jgi:hypothetical protein
MASSWLEQANRVKYALIGRWRSMSRPPLNPEPLLAIFMAKESAGSIAGDLEERFGRSCQRKGRLQAMLWFWWALLISLPPIIIHALFMNRSGKQAWVVLDSNLIVSFFLSWMALEMQLIPMRDLVGSKLPSLLDNVGRFQVSGRLSAGDAAEILAFLKLRNELVHRKTNRAPELTQSTIERLHRLIERLRQS